MPELQGNAAGDSVVSSREVFAGHLITVRVETLAQPIGGTQQFEIVEHPDAVAIVALRWEAGQAGEPSVALVRQQRPAIGRETWELPAGLVHPNEQNEPQRAAERELREETGYAATNWRQLIREYPSPGFSTEAITLYLATGVYPVSKDAGGRDREGQDEIDALDWVLLGEAMARCRRGEIDDGKTLLGLSLAAGGLDVGGGTTVPQNDVTLATGRTPSPTLYEQVAPQSGTDDTLKLDGLLLAEFDYASNSAYQAMEDRTRTFNLYLVIFGVLASFLATLYQFGNLKALTQPLTILLLAAGGILGLVFFVQLIRLRQAHQESIVTMNMIKEYYLRVVGQERPDIGRVFNWRLAGMKAGERFGSVTFLVCFTVALLDGLALAVASMVAYLLSSGSGAIDPQSPETYLPAGVLGIVVLAVAILLQVVYYRVALSRSREKQRIKDAEKAVAAAAASREGVPAGTRV